jgi:anthranilate synthase/aminodeoxychorismate synthase-like glutamine amidotransferase
LIDNYGAFTYNLVQYFGELGEEPVVKRNDGIRIEEAEGLYPDRIVFSPGPGRPENAGITLKAIKRFAGRIPLLGICLGHHAIAQAFGGRVAEAPYQMHGAAAEICHDGKTIFDGLDYRIKAGCYHALVVDRESVPRELEVSATTPDGILMAIRHRRLKIEGVQFHPDSVLTPDGKHLLSNFLKL